MQKAYSICFLDKNTCTAGESTGYICISCVNNNNTGYVLHVGYFLQGAHSILQTYDYKLQKTLLQFNLHNIDQTPTNPTTQLIND